MKMLHDHVTRNGMRDMSRHGCEVDQAHGWRSCVENTDHHRAGQGTTALVLARRGHRGDAAAAATTAEAAHGRYRPRKLQRHYRNYTGGWQPGALGSRSKLGAIETL